MRSITQKAKKISFLTLFSCLSLTGTVLFLIYSIVFGHISFQWLCMTNEPNYMFLDYFKHVLFTAEPSSLYEKANGVWGCFPPLIYILYSLLYRMTSYLGLTPENWHDFMGVDESLTVFLYYSIFVAIGIYVAIQKWQKKKGNLKLFVCLILSAPFFAGIERGNSIMLVLVLLLLALKWRDDESQVKREAALILIAIASGIKIYPAVFGCLYIKDRRYKEGFRLVVYGLLLFFVPFIFFGGFHGFLLWLSNINSTLVTYSIGRIEYIRGLVITVSYLFTGGRWTSDYLSLVMPNFFLVFMLVLFFLSQDKYRTVFYLCAIMTFYPSNAFRYTLSYLSIPLIMFLMEHADEKVETNMQFAEIAGFGLLFTIPTLFGFLTGFNERLLDINSHATYVEIRLYFVAYTLMGLIIANELIDIIKYKKIDRNLMRKI